MFQNVAMCIWKCWKEEEKIYKKLCAAKKKKNPIKSHLIAPVAQSFHSNVLFESLERSWCDQTDAQKNSNFHPDIIKSN